MGNEQHTTHNITPSNKDLEILKQNFPQCFDKDGNFDFDKFKNQLSKNEINFSKESYGMDWLGKSYARLLATDEATTLLKEDEAFNQKEENATSENLLIKGDNLEVLKHLSNAYYEKIKMIYIDPPYNTGGDGFVYEDDRKFTVEDLQELAGISEERAKQILEFTQSKSNSHSAWLTFMYPRLYIARQLLKEDGVIFVSIDDNEVAQLRLLMDEIFGEENFVAIYKWNKTSTPPALSYKVRMKYEYILCYEKNLNDIKYNGGLVSGGDMPLLNNGNTITKVTFPKESVIFNFDGFYKKGSYDRVILHNDLNILNGLSDVDITLEAPFKWTQNTVNKEIDNNTTFIIKSNKFSIRYSREGVRIKRPSDIISKVECNVGTNEDANKDILKLIDKRVMDYPKPISLIKYLIQFSELNDDSIILDFFAGSGTTGDAVMQLNAEDGGNRKFILVQLPELIDKKKKKTAYDFVKEELKVETPTIFEITKERLIRASKKIKEENTDKDLSNQDLGFKVFETMPIWEDYDYDADELEGQTTLFDETKLTNDDIKALLITWKTYDGAPLTEPLQEIDLENYTAYYTNGKLYLMDKGFETKNLKNLLEKIDKDKNFNPNSIIAFGYHFESKSLREISENIVSYTNKKNIDIDFITRY